MTRSSARTTLCADAERTADAWPRDWVELVRDTYRIDLTGNVLGEPIPHPIGKASGQLSLNTAQVDQDEQSGLAFVVLKTVIGERADGTRSMHEWATSETRMTVEERTSQSGRVGWTVTWKGRGWEGSLDSYAEFLRQARLASAGMIVIPSVKLHLPPLGTDFDAAEYSHTLATLTDAWGQPPFLIEHDFSPTLAGDPRSADQSAVLRWVRDLPSRMRSATAGAPQWTGRAVRIGLKLMNTSFGDEFQRELVAAAAADAVTVFNRLWDRERGVAFGGYDLLERNLRVLARRGGPQRSGTGGIMNGSDIVAYARAGCSSVQCHTIFQLPRSQFSMRGGTRTAAALHRLVFQPEDGLIAAMLDAEVAGWIVREGGELRFLDLLPAGIPRC